MDGRHLLMGGSYCVLPSPLQLVETFMKWYGFDAEKLGMESTGETIRWVRRKKRSGRH